MKKCCFTGHREMNEAEADIIIVLRSVIESMIEKGITEFISGGAIGFDTLCAKLIVSMKNEYPGLKLHLALPCRDQSKYWNMTQKRNYLYIIDNADTVEYISEKYTRWCMHMRNKHMVNNSDFVIAYCKKQSGGTFFTVDYAQKYNKEIINIAEMFK